MNRTFWSVAQECVIEIPLLQRDYAQGRLDPRAKQVRLDLVETCRAALSLEIAPTLELGLVYGAIRQEIAGAKRLVLLDGQQRVTTLYLLHWYLGRRGSDHESISGTLARFSYETRVTTREFCSALALEPFMITASRPLSAQIEDSSWFFQSWNQDPSIAGMLVMLDAIHDAFWQEQDVTLLWQRLVRDVASPIVFRFLDMPGFELTDELYIKMNARGRPLTEFEKFKAWLESTAAAFVLDEAAGADGTRRDWQEELDKEWTDFFWKQAGKKTAEMDTMFLRCFHSIALNHAVVTLAKTTRAESEDVPPQKTSEVIEEIIEAVIADNFLSTKVLRRLYTETTLRRIFLVMRRLCADALARTNEGDLFGLICSSRQRNYRERVAFHAWCCAMGSEAEPGNPAAIKRWQHVIWYLLSNSTVDRSEEYARVLRSIDAIGWEASADVDRFFAEKEPILIGFDTEHVREAIRKARIIRQHPEGSELAQKWQIALEDADNHPYFDGRINFLLDLSGADAATPDSLDSFIRFTAVAKRIFDEEKGLVERSDFLLQRALLAKDDEIVQIGRSWNLGRDRYYLRTYMFRQPRQIERLRLVLSELEQGHEEDGLHTIIETAATNDWRRYFTACPAAIGACGQGNTRWENTRWEGVNDWEEGRYIRLLWGENINGAFAELRSYCFFRQYLEPKSVEFIPLAARYQWLNKGSRDLPYAVLEAEEAKYRIEIRYVPWEPEATAYEILIRTTNGTTLPASISEPDDPSCRRSCSLRDCTGMGWYYPGENEAAEGLKRLAMLAFTSEFKNA